MAVVATEAKSANAHAAPGVAGAPAATGGVVLAIAAAAAAAAVAAVVVPNFVVFADAEFVDAAPDNSAEIAVSDDVFVVAPAELGHD